MKADSTIQHDGQYSVTVRGTGQMSLYRNRVRLASTESLDSVTWHGKLERGDLLEADGPFVEAMEVTHDTFTDATPADASPAGVEGAAGPADPGDGQLRGGEEDHKEGADPVA